MNANGPQTQQLNIQQIRHLNGNHVSIQSINNQGQSVQQNGQIQANAQTMQNL
jgi:hypothetical protein